MREDMKKSAMPVSGGNPAVRNPVSLQALQAFDQKDRKADKAKKRLFIGLVMGTNGMAIFFLFLVWAMSTFDLAHIHPLVPILLGLVIGCIIVLVGLASLSLVLSIRFGKTLPFFSRMRGLTVKLFLPFMILLGQAIGISKNKVRSSFVEVNNELVLKTAGRYKPEEMLLLMPHCLQRSKCKIRLTYSIHNCKRCGKCPISDLIALSERYSVFLAIATGGTIARRIVIQRMPKMIVAVACERDMAGGIQDTYPLPVYGVLNTRPHGPCLDTQVSIENVERAIRRFMQSRYYPENLHQEQDAGNKETAAVKEKLLETGQAVARAA
ncbi:MAG: DUF116 domain-containing protein [Thermodesulfobacteriota bacterium]|nr:DUF116 domain-containing protein [Thermodesulfobacteriota bacterium]